MKICVVGLGYVGLPLVIRFGKIEETNGFDIDNERIRQLSDNHDWSGETAEEELRKTQVNFSSDPRIISDSDFIIIAVPTPIDKARKPDLGPLLGATRTVAKNLKKGSVIVYESTVYPGCTEEDCIPVLEKVSGMTCGKDFRVGYSPERMNPGDKIHTLDKIIKIISGMDQETLEIIEKQYAKICHAGLFKASSIKVAEAAKVIENTQRDINIALMNELKMIFDLMDIPSDEVIEAASTKWNFNRFTPGLVGGHCIGVDPYYLAFKSEMIGHHPEMILAGRRINDHMARYEGVKIIKHMTNKGTCPTKNNVLILGATFKPNINDLRNSKVKILAEELTTFGCKVFLHDPHVEDKHIWGYENIGADYDPGGFAFTILAVRHNEFKDKRYDYEVLK
jgi:UDP-N-acetyl-D-galactosamine dehydrogenase